MLILGHLALTLAAWFYALTGWLPKMGDEA